MLSDAIIGELIAARHAEKAQALYYRALSAQAEAAAHEPDIEALNGLLADEQHHLSRLMVRLVELGVTVPEPHIDVPRSSYPEWRNDARERERNEVARYERLLREPLDEETAAALSLILDAERQHEKNLGGKYTDAWNHADD